MSSEIPTIAVALSNVMAAVQAVRKGDRNQQQGFNFRGIDAVVNAVGPALRQHGVVAVPVTVASHFEQYATKSGTTMRSAVLTITWRFYGPAGDFIEAQTMGEASDAGDKSVSKAHSVAYRTLLLQALCIPTDEPDPDTQTHERATRPPADPAPLQTRITAAASRDELSRVGTEIGQANLTDHDRELLRASYRERLAELSPPQDETLL